MEKLDHQTIHIDSPLPPPHLNLKIHPEVDSEHKRAQRNVLVLHRKLMLIFKVWVSHLFWGVQSNNQRNCPHRQKLVWSPTVSFLFTSDSWEQIRDSGKRDSINSIILLEYTCLEEAKEEHVCWTKMLPICL